MRKTPYLVSLFFLLAATTLTLLNVHVADLIHIFAKPPGPLQFETKYGLYRRCTRKTVLEDASLAFLMPSQPPQSPLTDGPIFDPIDTEGDGWQCQEFPSKTECERLGEKTCVLWSTAGYAAQLSLVPCLAALISLLFIFLHRGHRGARAKARRQQWKLVSGTMVIHCALQILSIALIAHVYRTDDRFKSGAHLDQSYYFGMASAITSGVMAVLLTFTGLSAKAGHEWAGGQSVKKRRSHRRTRSGRVVVVPEVDEAPKSNERTGLLDEPASDYGTASA